MLISTRARLRIIDNHTYKLNLNFPKIFLDKFDYKISVRSLSVESSDYFVPCRYSLRTTAVDKNALNPDQEIASIVPVEASYYLNYNPRNLFEYKIQLKDVHTADFFLFCSKKVGLQALSNLYIIFEITRDVRIQ